jgi:biotin transport system substrate-specific component
VATLVSYVVEPVRLRRHLVLALAAVAASLLVAGLSQLSVPLPFTPVPITGQTLGVVLTGAALGPGWGITALLLYLVEGGVGLPFFAGGTSGWHVLLLGSATAGYLWGFVVAACLVGFLASRGWDRSVRSAISAMFLGNVTIYLVGVPWLMAVLHLPLQRGLVDGLYPFVIGDVIKIAIAAVALPSAWRLIGRLGAGPADRPGG